MTLVFKATSYYYEIFIQNNNVVDEGIDLSLSTYQEDINSVPGLTVFLNRMGNSYMCMGFIYYKQSSVYATLLSIRYYYIFPCVNLF